MPNSSDRIFKNELRVTRNDFHFILSKMQASEVFTRRQLDVEYQLAIALSRFGEYGSASSWMKKAARFGVGEGTIQVVTDRVIEVNATIF